MPYRRRFKPSNKLTVKAMASPEVLATVRQVKNQRTTQKLSLPNGDLPQSLLVNMRYVENNIPMSGLTTATAGYYNFKLNSIYDFNQTGTGSQPTPYNAFSGIYDYYMVNAVKVTVRMRNTDTDQKLTWGILFADATPAGVLSLDQLRRSCHASMTLEQADAGSSGEQGTLEAYIDLKKFFVDYDIASQRAAYGGDPSDLLYMTIYAVSQDETNLTTEPMFDIEAVMYVELYEPNPDRAID